MSQKTTDPTGHLEVSESPERNLSKLAELARQAYEQKRTKDCLDLTRAILLIDPNNASAHWMRSSIQSEMQRDLEHARVFLRQVQAREIPDTTPPQADSPASSEVAPSPAAEDLESPVPEAVPETPADSNRRWARWFVPVGVFVVLAVMAAGLYKFMPRLKPTTASRASARAPANGRQRRSRRRSMSSPSAT